MAGRTDGLELSGYAAIFRPPEPPSTLKARGYAVLSRAQAGGYAAPSEAECRSGLDDLVDAFLLDRQGSSSCFTLAHRLGQMVNQRFGCPMKRTGRGTWAPNCPISALHARIGMSYGGTSRGHCSICDKGDLQCSHVPGRTYEGEPCIRIVDEVDLDEISYVSSPEDPRCYRVEQPISDQEVEAQLGRPLMDSEVPECLHCPECYGVTEGPKPADLDPELWSS